MTPTTRLDGPHAKTKREQILVGARRVFLREGFAAASTEAIAREAGVSTRTLYAYFPSKNQLFSAVLRALTVEHPQHGMPRWVVVANPRRVEDLRKALVALATNALSVMMNPEYLALLRTLIAESQRFPEVGELFRATVPERGIMALQSLLARARANGVAMRGDPDLLPRLFIGPLLTYMLLDGVFRPEGEVRSPDPATVEQIITLYLHAITQEPEHIPPTEHASTLQEG